MNPIVDFQFISESKTKDSTGQVVSVKSYENCLGMKRSIYEREFHQASQSGIRPEFVIETSAFNYGGQALIQYNGNEYSIYRTFQKGTDRIELYCSERVGNNDGSGTGS